MSEKGVSRVHYFDRQFLRVQDFVDEQAYEIGMRRRHNLAGHSWGIVSGLQITVEEGGLFVQPGMAIDGFGRELVLVTKQPIPASEFENRQTDQLGVWLAYDMIGTDSPLAGYDDCANGENLFYRWQEQPRVWLLSPDPAHTDPRRPKQVLENDLKFGPTLTPPDDPQRSWPVYLGMIQRDLSNKKQPYSVSLSGRPYIGLVGESIAAPSGRVKVQVGSEKNADKNRFAVFIPEAQPTGTDPVPQMAIDTDGNLSVQGETTIHGNLTISGGAMEFGMGQAVYPQPWRIYQHLETQNNQQMRRELRVEIDGGTNGNNQVVIGVWSTDEKKFKPVLTIDDNSTVTVHGNLVVEGRLDPPPQIVPGTPNAQAKSFLTGSFLAGAGGSPVLLAQTGAAGMYSEVSMRAAAHALSSNPDQVSKFADMVKKEFSGLAEDLHAKLK